MICTVQLMQHNWFKRKNWELQAGFAKKKYAIDLKKIEKQLGFNTQKGGVNVHKNQSEALNIGNLAGFLPLLKNLDGEQLQNLIEVISGNVDTEPSGAIEQIISSLPPELIQSFIQGISKGAAEKKESSEGIEYEG